MAGEANVKSGALLGFKVGLQSTVDTMLAAGANASAEHGCFYLTKDSHRLYVGNEDGSLSAVNEGIQTVTWSELTAIANTAASSAAGTEALRGRFYYASDENILCVYNGRRWVSLNDNTNTTIETNTYTVTSSTGTTGGVDVSNTIADSASGTYTDTFTVVGANGVTTTCSGKVITITGDTYTLGTTTSGRNVEINLDSSGTNNDSEVTLVAGTNVTLTNDAVNKEITIATEDTTADSLTIAAGNAGYTFTLVDTKGGQVAQTVDPQIAYYTSASANDTTTNAVHFVSGTATLDVYSRGAIDAKLKAVNAMTYRGTIGAAGTAANTISYNSTTGVTSIQKNGVEVPVSIGDCFMSLGAGTYIQAYKANSLFIVRAKDGASEGSDGLIASGDYICDVVAEMWFADTTYTLEAITNGIELVSSTDDHCGQLVITAGSNNNWIDVSSSSDGTTQTITVTHKNVTRSDTDTTNVPTVQGPKASITIPAVHSVTTDNKGHVTGVVTRAYTVVDTNADLTDMSATTSAYTNTSGGYQAGVITSSATLTKSDDSTQTEYSPVVISSSSLSISKQDRPVDTTSQTNRPGLKIEMLWGSF